jgi:hypothetical protein
MNLKDHPIAIATVAMNYAISTTGRKTPVFSNDIYIILNCRAHPLSEAIMSEKNPAAVSLGRKGGESKSDAKRAAAALNAAKATAARMAKRKLKIPLDNTSA